jgi:hypothetical protein
MMELIDKISRSLDDYLKQTIWPEVRLKIGPGALDRPENNPKARGLNGE